MQIRRIDAESRPALLVAVNEIDIPTMKRKAGNTKSANVNPIHSA
jgi:hypothetical protein